MAGLSGSNIREPSVIYKEMVIMDNEDLKELQADYKDLMERFRKIERCVDWLKSGLEDFGENWANIEGEECS